MQPHLVDGHNMTLFVFVGIPIYYFKCSTRKLKHRKHRPKLINATNFPIDTIF